MAPLSVHLKVQALMSESFGIHCFVFLSFVLAKKCKKVFDDKLTMEITCYGLITKVLPQQFHCSFCLLLVLP